MSLLAWLLPTAAVPDAGRERRDVLAAAAVALSELPAGKDVEPILRIAVEAARAIAGAGAALVVVDGDGRVERVVADGLDRATRDAFGRADVAGTLLLRLGATDGRVDRKLASNVPRGIVALPVGGSAVLVVVPADGEIAIGDDAFGVLALLARLTAGALERAHVVATCAELRRLCTDVLVRQEEEAGRTAHEVHEGICQRLAAANAQLEALRVLVDGRGAAHACLRDARALVNQTLGELRELAQRLRPAVLENLGYVEALRWYLDRLRARDGVAPSLEIEGAETRLPVAMETALYRATEHALGAAAETRGARDLHVRYRREPEAVRIEIAGPSPEVVDLVAMRERLRPFGGAVVVNAPPDRVPVIEMQMPAPASGRIG